MRAGGRVQLTRFWSVFGSIILGPDDARRRPDEHRRRLRPIRHRVGISYEDECLEFGLTWRRDYTQVLDARRGNSFVLKLALKNLGR